MRWFFSKLRMPLGVVLAIGAGTAAASTLDNVTLGASLFSANDLDVIASDTSIEAADLFGGAFIFAPIDGGNVDMTAATDTDLSIFGATFTEILGGTALDIEADTSADTFSILYGLTINEESSDPFAVAVLSFGADLSDGILGSVGDLDGEVVDVEIFGALRNSSATVIPLPAGLPLLFGAIGALVIARRRTIG